MKALGKRLNLRQIKIWTYAFFLTNTYGIKLQKIIKSLEKKMIRLQYARQLLEKLHIDIHVQNIEHLPSSGPFLLIVNHRSIIDPLIIDILLQDKDIFVLWIAKKELYDSLLFGNAVRNGGCIRVSREKTDMPQFFSDIKKGITNGDSICIFPEGTRNRTEKELLAFKEGVRIISLKFKLPILPVYIQTNTDKVLDIATKIDQRSNITVIVGDMIDYKNKENIETLYREMFNIQD